MIRCTTRKVKSLLFDLFKAFDLIESSHNSIYFLEKSYFLNACAKCFKLPSNLTLVLIGGWNCAFLRGGGDSIHLFYCMI